MPSTDDLISGLTFNSDQSGFNLTMLINQFREELGWVPSYGLDPSTENSFVSTHFVVEHGLQNSAIITFSTKSYYDLSNNVRKALLNISYNNLVDWHIHLENNQVITVNNRLKSDSKIVKKAEFYKDHYTGLRSDAFEKIIGKKHSP